MGKTPEAAAVAAPTDEMDVEFIDKVRPTLKRLRDYTRLKVKGLEHIPDKGPALLVGNHTGWLGLDYALTAFSVLDATDRVVRGMAHAAWFANPATAKFAKRMGIFQVSKEAMRERLAKGDLVMMFPEGEKGAFKPGDDYKLEEFARGFVRVAMETGIPVIPVAILGGEEANPVGTRIESYEELVNLRGGLPIPKNLIPRPVKWRIEFLEPLDFSDCTADDASDGDRVHDIAENTRKSVQRAVNRLKAERGNPWF